jgi:glycosyltransferase involved in cell wall biosynthesis
MGGPLSSILSIINNLSPYFNFKVITLDRDLGDLEPYPNVVPNVWTKVGACEVYYLSNSKMVWIDLIKTIRATKYDKVYLNSFFEPLFSISVAFAHKIGFVHGELIIAPRGEFFDEALAFKPTKKKLFLRLARFLSVYTKIIWHATDEREKQFILKNLKVNNDNIKVAMVLSDVFFHKETISTELNNSVLKVIFLARISKDKNLSYTFKVLSRLNIDIVFDIFGPIEDHDIWDSCQHDIALLPQNIKVVYKGELKRSAVRDSLKAYDLFFLPTFAENFGHSIAESLSVGTPVLISDNTPWLNLKEKGWGWDFPLTEIDQFVNSILELDKLSVSDKYIKRKTIIEGFNNSFSGDLIISQYLSLFETK